MNYIDVQKVKVHDLYFEKYISEEKILARVQEMGNELNGNFSDKKPIFLGILNGCFMFMSDIVRACDFECEMSFVKISSYLGTKSTNKINTLIGLNESLKGRHVIIAEDIIDSGKTIYHLIDTLNETGVASITIVTLLLKPDSVQFKFPIDLVGFEIPNDFVVGYGLDYDGLGRNLKDIYSLVK